MAHGTLKVAPGVDTNKTLALNEAALSKADKIRFMQDKSGLGLVQKLGGWKPFYPSQYGTTIRALLAWDDVNAVSHLGVGLETKSEKMDSGYTNTAQLFLFYTGDRIFKTGSPVELVGFEPSNYDGVYYVLDSQPGKLVLPCAINEKIEKFGRVYTGDCLSVITNNTNNIITPTHIETNYFVSATTTAGSAEIVITDKNIQLLDGDAVIIGVPISVGGLNISGLYNVNYVGENKYGILARNVLGALTPATETKIDGGVVPTYVFTLGSSYVEVQFPDSNLYDGANWPIITPFYVGTEKLYGNYNVVIADEYNKKDKFLIQTPNIVSAGKTVALPSSVSSDGSRATFVLPQSYYVTIYDTVTIFGISSTYDGTYRVIHSYRDGENYVIQVPSDLDWNDIENPGHMFKSTGSLADRFTVSVYGEYTFHVNDVVEVSGFVPESYNGTYKVLLVGDNWALVETPGISGAITKTGSIYIRSAQQNEGLAHYEYFKTPGPMPTSTGYGIGGYGAGGYGVGGVGRADKTYGTPIVATDWTLDNWGSVLIACPVNGPVYSWDPTSGIPSASIMANAPMANDGVLVAMPQRQIIAWGSTFNGIQDPMLVRWCDINNYNSWVGTPTNQAGSFRVSTGSKIVACIQGPQQGILWTDVGVWSMQYVGQPYIYNFTEIGNGCGLIGRKAAGSIAGVIFWMSQTQFFMLGGMGGDGIRPIQCSVWDTMFQELDTNYVNNIRFAANSYFNEVQWFYPTHGSNGRITKYVKFNTQLNAWDIGELNRTAWINQSVFGPPIGAGGDNIIYQHEIGYDDGNLPMRSYFQTGYFQVADAEYKIFIDQVWPDFKWGTADGVPDADLMLTFFVADYPTNEPQIYGPMPINAATEFLTPRFRGRLVSIKIESNDLSSFWRIGATRYRFTPDGKF